jgi:hypothetical protein
MKKVISILLAVVLSLTFTASSVVIGANEKSNEIKLTMDDISIVFTLNSKTATVNGKKVNLDVPAQIVDGEIMIPLDFVAENLKIDASYDSSLTETEAKAETKPEPKASTGSNKKFVVYWGHTGDKVHIKPDCRTIKNGALSGTLDAAKAAGHTNGWCGVCSGGMTDEVFLKNGNPNAK